MIQNSTEHVNPLLSSCWAKPLLLEKGKSFVHSRLVRSCTLFSLKRTASCVYIRGVCVSEWSFSSSNLQKNVQFVCFPVVNYAISVALAALGACWTMQKWKEHLWRLYHRTIYWGIDASPVCIHLMYIMEERTFWHTADPIVVIMAYSPRLSYFYWHFWG